jgi:hypothetical protein
MWKHVCQTAVTKKEHAWYICSFQIDRSAVAEQVMNWGNLIEFAVTEV